ncbi:hypothetical protein Taro_049414 [Colocasia esculenta]|uniref:Uncharacterized protein n=1 Tax=Colocasia esculenta TaxID=4460 RepID=A0A843XAV6_COLES|nr:hypothetical protein [Colocasia esculenta]
MFLDRRLVRSCVVAVQGQYLQHFRGRRTRIKYVTGVTDLDEVFRHTTACGCVCPRISLRREGRPGLVVERFELEGASARVRMVYVVLLVVSSVSSGRLWFNKIRVGAAVGLLLLQYALSVLVMALVVCCVTCSVCLVALCCLVVSSGEVFPELFLAYSGGGFSQNFFVLVSVLLPSRLRCIVGLRCAVGWLVHSGGFSQNGALVILVECVALTTGCGRVDALSGVLLRASVVHMWLCPCVLALSFGRDFTVCEVLGALSCSTFGTPLVVVRSILVVACVWCSLAVRVGL